MATKNNPGQFDCYDKAEPDEPMFVLLARDKHAPTLVWLWSVLRELDQEKPEKVAEARNCACAMIDWQSSKGGKSVGMGESVLAGVLELIRGANYAASLVAAADPTAGRNAPTTVDTARAFFTRTIIDQPDA